MHVQARNEGARTHRSGKRRKIPCRRGVGVGQMQQPVGALDVIRVGIRRRRFLAVMVPVRGRLGGVFHLVHAPCDMQPGANQRTKHQQHEQARAREGGEGAGLGHRRQAYGGYGPESRGDDRTLEVWTSARKMLCSGPNR